MQGIETLPLRMQRHCENALAVAQHLEAHPCVAWVNYPGLPSSPGYALAQRYLGSPRHPGAGALLAFGVKGGQQAGERFIDALQFCSHLANIGDAKTLVIHPASTTHRQMAEADQRASGVTPDMVRLSVGIETLDDILWDIDQALERSAS
jgi:O-acetylhomoserine (thiol)-lyase